MQQWRAFEKGPWNYARVKKAVFLSSCKYTHGVVAGFLGRSVLIQLQTSHPVESSAV